MHKTPIPYLFQSSGPAEEPLTLAETKLFLRVDSTSEDTLISSLITVARNTAEHYTRRSFITQSWLLAFDDYAPQQVKLPKGPVQSVDSVKITDRNGNQTTVSTSTYYMNAGRELLCFDVIPIGHNVEITYTAGYGDATDIPQAIKQGMLEHIAEMYEKRGNADVPGTTTLSLLNPYRVVEL